MFNQYAHNELNTNDTLKIVHLLLV